MYLSIIYLSDCLSIWLSNYLITDLSVNLSVYLFICLSIYCLSIWFSVFPTLSDSPPIWLSVCLCSVCLSTSSIWSFVSPPYVEHFSLRNVPHGTTAYLFSIPPRPLVFTTLDLRDCFAPQQNALFRHGRSKSGPRPSVFNTLDESASRQMHLLLRHLNVQKWPENM
jgi:hypothetical protein